MKLTRDIIGDAEFDKGWADIKWFRGHPLGPRAYAKERGNHAASYIQTIQWAVRESAMSEAARDRVVEDAVMFAKMAFRGWRAYRLMEGRVGR